MSDSSSVVGFQFDPDGFEKGFEGGGARIHSLLKDQRVAQEDFQGLCVDAPEFFCQGPWVLVDEFLRVTDGRKVVTPGFTKCLL